MTMASAVERHLNDIEAERGADLGDLVLYVVKGAVDVGSDIKLDRGHGNAVRHIGKDVPDAIGASDRILDLSRDLGFKFARRCTRLVDRHLNDREIDVGKPGDRQCHETADAQDREYEKADDRRHRRSHGPRRDVERHFAASRC